MKNKTGLLERRWASYGALSGLIGGLAMAVFLMASSIDAGHSAWWPLNLMGGAEPFFRPVSPVPVIPHAGRFNPELFWPGTAVGAALHMLTAMVWGVLYGITVAAISARIDAKLVRSWGFALGAGLMWGVIVWIAMGLFAGPRLSPALGFLNPGPYLVGHMIFGGVTAIVFAGLIRRKRVVVSFDPTPTTAGSLRQRR